MKKLRQFKALKQVPDGLLNNLGVFSVNITTSSQSSFDALASKFYSPGEKRVETKYGSGPLTYEGHTNGTGIITAESTSALPKKSFLVRAEGQEAFERVQEVFESNPNMKNSDYKLSSIQVVMGMEIPAGINPTTLIPDAMENQQGLTSKRLKVALNSAGHFEVGTKSSTAHIQVARSRMESSPAKTCLCLTAVVKETKAGFFEDMAKQNLQLGDFAPLGIRSALEQLIECDLKHIVLSTLKDLYSLPSKERLKPKKVSVLPPKVKYLQTALGSSIKYLDDESLKDSAKVVIESFLKKLIAKGFPISGVTSSISTTTLPATTGSDSTTEIVQQETVDDATTDEIDSTGKKVRGKRGASK